MEHEYIKLIFGDDVEIETERNDLNLSIIFGDLWQYLDKYDWSFYDSCVVLSEKDETLQVIVGCDEYKEYDDSEDDEDYKDDEEEYDEDGEEDYEPPRQGTVWLYFDEKLNFIESDGALD